MAKLKATRPVLFRNRLYQPGEELPQTDPVRVNAWLEAGSAVREPKKAPLAETLPEPETAEPPAKSKAKGRAAQ